MAEKNMEKLNEQHEQHGQLDAPELILRALPHRHPFLLVDRVLAYEAGKSIVARKNVTISEPFFEGHFPDKPVMPGVLIIEALAQTCGVLFFLSRGNAGEHFYLTGVEKCRFRRMVRPGDTLTMHCVLEKQVRDLFRFAARAEVDGEVACESQLLAVRPSNEAGS